MKRIFTKNLILIGTIFFLLNACASKQPLDASSDSIGVATVVGTSGGVALGSLVGGMLGLLVSGGTGATAPLIGVVVGAVSTGSLGYSIGQTIDN